LRFNPRDRGQEPFLSSATAEFQPARPLTAIATVRSSRASRSARRTFQPPRPRTAIATVRRNTVYELVGRFQPSRPLTAIATSSKTESRSLRHGVSTLATAVELRADAAVNDVSTLATAHSDRDQHPDIAGLCIGTFQPTRPLATTRPPGLPHMRGPCFNPRDRAQRIATVGPISSGEITAQFQSTRPRTAIATSSRR
jgi:hypothetical protein